MKALALNVAQTPTEIKIYPSCLNNHYLAVNIIVKLRLLKVPLCFETLSVEQGSELLFNTMFIVRSDPRRTSYNRRAYFVVWLKLVLAMNGRLVNCIYLII